MSFTIADVNTELFENLDIENAINLLESKETKEAHAYLYLIKKIFKNDIKTALCHLYASNDTDHFNMIIAHNAHFCIDLNIDYDKTVNYYLKIAQKVNDNYIKDKSSFNSKLLYSELKNQKSTIQLIEQLVNLITAGDIKAEEEFLKYIQNGRVSPTKYEKILKFLAKKGNGGAMGILGKMYYEGSGVEKCVETAMHYFSAGAIVKDAVCFNGMGDIHMMNREYLQARKYYEDGSKKGNPESDYNLYTFYRDVHDAEDRALGYLLNAANKGYLPALYGYGMRLYKQKNYRSAIMYFAPICDYTEIINDLQSIAENYFVEEKYESALIPLLFCAEMGSVHAIYNILYMADFVKNFKLYDKNTLIYNMNKKVTDMGYKTNIVKLGNCYYHGIGTKQSYIDAFTFYLDAALERNPEGVYCLAYLYEHGLGVEKDLNKSLDYIIRIGSMNNNLYLLVWYVGMKLMVKILLSWVFTKFTFVLFMLIGTSVALVYTIVKKNEAKIKKD